MDSNRTRASPLLPLAARPHSFTDKQAVYPREMITHFSHAAHSKGMDQKELHLIKHIIEKGIAHSKGLDQKELHLIKHIIEKWILLIKKEQPPSATCCAEAELSSSMIEDESRKPRYLLVSNGCAIFLLDFKMGKNEPISNSSDVQSFPKLATLKLIENDLPVSVGLFRLGLDAFMIGGQEFPDNVELLQSCNKDDNPWGSNLYTSFCLTHLVKGTSHATWCLSLANDHTLSPSQCYIQRLNSPKLWPVVEVVDGEIHVFDSAPSSVWFKADHDWIFSHEVLEGDGRWTQIPTAGAPMEHFITSHLVIGHHIYAVASGEFLLFDSRTKKWTIQKGETHGPCCECLSAFNAQTAWHVICHGNAARCVGIFGDSLYVIIAVVRSYGADIGTHALAYLVNSTGQVICSQRLHHFFEGRVKPYFMASGTIIKVDEVGNSLYAVVLNGGDESTTLVEGIADKSFLFINTFTVEELPGAVINVRQLLEKEPKTGAFLQQEFVLVAVKDKYVYKTDTSRHYIGMQACLL